MNTNGTCPACQGKLSLWAGLKAPTPFFIKCPDCKTKLRVRMRGLWFFVLFMVALIICAVVGVMIAWHEFGLKGLILGTACYLVFLVLADIAMSVVYYTYAKFDFTNRSKDA
jgi:hypothetical protein